MVEDYTQAYKEYIEVVMSQFDSLPPNIRKIIRESDIGYSAAKIEVLYQRYSARKKETQNLAKELEEIFRKGM